VSWLLGECTYGGLALLPALLVLAPLLWPDRRR
jgi:hypothetical protein